MGEWVDCARRTDVAALWERCRRRSVQVTWLGEQHYPSALADLEGRPAVLFWVGDIGWVERCPVVSVVGTRRCTPEGALTAYELARDLAKSGVCVASGLALGIDGAAHAGALAGFAEARAGSGPAGEPRVARADARAGTWSGGGGAEPLGDEEAGAAPTVGVAASGVDVVYPRQHAALWRRVASAGAVVSETPPGSCAQSWRFPARNRVIAGLAKMVVVVESHAAGGSWYTVDAALRAGIEVGAVPGSVRSSASAGTNSLLREGATPVRGAEDVLDALGLAVRLPVGKAGGRGAPASKAAGSQALSCPSSVPHDRPPAPGQWRSNAGDHAKGAGPLEQRVLSALGGRPVCLDEVVERSGLPVTAAVVTLERLEAAGALACEGGWWWRV